MAKPKGSRGGKKSDKETKADTVEVAVGSLLSGDNVVGIKDLAYHQQNILGRMAIAKKANKGVSDAKAVAREAGVDVSAITDTLKLTNMDPIKLAAKLRQQAALMSKEGLPVQIALFEPKYGSIDEQAAEEGHKRGLLGKSPDVERWKEGTPGHDAHMRSWNDAQRQLVTGEKQDGGEEAVH